MESTSILILGDSTSMTVGYEEKSYPFILSKEKIWPKNTTIYNASLHGFASADGLKFLNNHINNISNIKVAIINLAICDSIAAEKIKGKFVKNNINFITKINKYFFKNKKNLLKNNILYYAWNKSFDIKNDQPEDESDFLFNLSNIIKICNNKSIKVILIQPASNDYFLPGLAKGNFIFYKYLGIKDKISNLINIDDEKFKKSMEAFENNDFELCMKLYQKLLLENESNVVRYTHL